MNLEKDLILKLLKEIFPDDELRKKIMKVHDLYTIKYIPSDHTFYNYKSMIKDERFFNFNSIEVVEEKIRNMIIHSCLIDALSFDHVTWISILENDQKGAYSHWRFFRQRLFSILSIEDKIIVENYLGSGNYCSHKLEIKKLNEEFNFNDSKITFQKIWKMNNFEIDEKLIPLIYVLKTIKESLSDSIEFEFDCLLISLFVKLSNKESNIFVSSKIQNLSSKFQLGLYYANIINDVLECPYDMTEVNLMYSGESFSKIFSILQTKETSIEDIIEKFCVKEKYLNLKNVLK